MCRTIDDVNSSMMTAFWATTAFSAIVFVAVVFSWREEHTKLQIELSEYESTPYAEAVEVRH